MSTENKPLEKEEVVNGDENISNIQPEPETESVELSEEIESDNLTVDPADDDSGGSNPPADKPRG